MKLLALLSTAAMVLGSAPASAAPQLVLPRKALDPARAPPAPTLEEGRQRGDLAPHLRCTLCGERNYTAPRTPGPQGQFSAWCARCGRVTAHEDSGRARARSGRELDLPAAQSPAPERAPERAPSAARPEPEQRLWLPDEVGVATRAFQALEPVQGGATSSAVLDSAAQAVFALGEPGLVAARLELASESTPRLVAAAQVLLMGGDPRDAEAVVRRLEGRLPNPAAAPLLELLARFDPVRASPELYVRLLAHEQPAVRAAALRRVRQLAPAAVLPHLDLLFASRRADTRQKGVELAAAVDGPEATERLLERLSDPGAKVASAVVQALARRADPELDGELVRRAFSERWILRPQAYALLALVEREDAQVRAILDASHVEPLLAGLETKDPFVSGACAAALAGLGFRSERPSATAWLDRLVPERLVWAVSGREFHNDTSSLLAPASRRLRLISGEHPTGEGQAWIDWWLAAREGFRAQRAVLELGPAGADPLVLSWRSARSAAEGAEGPAGAFVLLGPAARDARSELAGERFYLSSEEAAGALRVLEQEGLLDARRLPGLRGGRGAAERTLEIALGSQVKRFQLGAGAVEPWFERVVAMARELGEKNRWQRYPPPELAGQRERFLASEAPFWAATQDEGRRARRLAELALAWLPAQPLARRDGALLELERLFAHPQVPAEGDFEPLLGLLGEERFHAERSRRLVGLALRAATAGSGATGEAALAGARLGASASLAGAARELARSRPPWPGPWVAAALVPASVLSASAPASLDRARAMRLLELLHDRFGPPAAEELARVCAAAGRELALELAGGERALLRAVGGAVLAHDPSPEEVRVLLGLLADPDPAVGAAVIRAVGHQKVEAARTELLVRARVAEPSVRREALRAIGALGGEYVYEALLLGISDPDPELRTAAAQGLALLGDPRSSIHLARMLDEPPGSEAYAAGLSGLEQLGSAGRPALGRVVHSRDHPARRDAGLILARQGAPEVVPALIALLAESPTDEPLAFELCVLTCIDARGRPDPIEAWWTWWDGVVHEDPTAWFLAALERRELGLPSGRELLARGGREAALFLLRVLEEPEPWLVERARRELARLLGRRIPPVPPRGPERDEWLAIARRWIDPGLDR